MAGIYIHIPFCVSRCQYCDFFSTTRLTERHRYVDAVLAEYILRRHELTEPVKTIYLGGGTPSVLEEEDLQRLLSALPLSETVEVTMEANPSDITLDKAQTWRQAGINRLSIGVQSCNDQMLKTLGRRHDAATAVNAVHMVQQAGMNNVSIDLMYGLPNQRVSEVEEDVQKALDLGVQHISTYCLSYEQGTPFTQRLQQGEWKETDDDTLNAMYDSICTHLTTHGFEHYEVSNFALPGCRSQHNSSYWTGAVYMGLGAGAHSYDGVACRRWNKSDIDAYMQGAEQQNIPFECEHLTAEQRLTEQIMLGLRTREGIDKQLLSTAETQKHAATWMKRGMLREQNGRLTATQQGIHVLNCIIEDLI